MKLRLYFTFFGLFLLFNLSAQIDQKRYNANQIKMDEVAEGKIVPDVELEDINGNKVKLSDFRGKILVLDIWATWCRSCVKEFPKLAAIQEKYKEQDVVFITISADTFKEGWASFLHKNEYSGNHFHMKNKSKNPLYWLCYQPNTYQGQTTIDPSLPEYTIIGKDGTILLKHTFKPSSKYFDEILAEYL